MRHVTVERDDWTPWYERTKAELAQLAQAEIHVGILGSADGELLKIAAVHEFGATIHPRNAKNLAIPLSPRARGGGTPGLCPRGGKGRRWRAGAPTALQQPLPLPAWLFW